MPAQRAILHDILVNRLDPTKKHADLSKSGNLKQVELPKEQKNENLFLSKAEVAATKKDLKSKKEEPVVLEQAAVAVEVQEEIKEEQVEQAVEKTEEPVETATEEQQEEKPKKKLFQKKKSKDDIVL